MTELENSEVWSGPPKPAVELGTGSTRAIQGSGLEKVDIYKDFGFNIDYTDGAGAAGGTFQAGSTMTLRMQEYDHVTPIGLSRSTKSRVTD